MNTSPIPRTAGASAFRQRGVALVVALILLVVATLMGLAGIQGTTLQERMSANMYDRSLAMQVSEAALRAAEAAITGNADVGTDCRLVLCALVPADTFTGTSAGWTDVGGQYLVNVARTTGTPQFHIQLMAVANSEDELGQGQSANTAQYGGGGGVPIANHYRVTARSSVPAANNDRAIVVLHSTVRRDL